jgi:hypothetical protein
MNTKRITRLLEFAYPLCLEIPRPKKHVSLVLRKGRVVSVGSNAMKTHPIAKEHGYMFEEMHSELDAFLRCGEPKKGLTLFNIRFNRMGQMRMARPCHRCMPWCVGVFESIWYTTDEGVMLHGEGLLPINRGVKESRNEEIHTIP